MASKLLFGRQNRFVLLRHGQSLANVQKIIVSLAINGTKKEYALSSQGQAEARKAADQILSKYAHDDIVVVASDFSRTQETATIVSNNLGGKCSSFITDVRLRERTFGEFELTSSVNYARVWDEDQASSSHQKFGVEAVDSVLQRAVSAVTELNERYTNHVIILVSHGDTLQILQTFFEGTECCGHRSLEPLATCVPRLMHVKTT
eukprot:m.152914 g.152914  ORF g.152914 m.152914 type:complete len:205 (-) comp30817_c4_seq1:564-1178(-)